MPKVAIVLDEEHQTELQMLVQDKDEAAAWRFLKEVVWAQIQDMKRKGLRGHLEKGQA